jgi:hypothetical protein
VEFTGINMQEQRDTREMQELRGGMDGNGGTKGRNIQGGKYRHLGMEYTGTEIQELRDGDESTILTKPSSDHDLIIQHCHDRKFWTLEAMLLDDRLKT